MHPQEYRKSVAERYQVAEAALGDLVKQTTDPSMLLQKWLNPSIQLQDACYEYLATYSLSILVGTGTVRNVDKIVSPMLIFASLPVLQDRMVDLLEDMLINIRIPKNDTSIQSFIALRKPVMQLLDKYIEISSIFTVSHVTHKQMHADASILDQYFARPLNNLPGMPNAADIWLKTVFCPIFESEVTVDDLIKLYLNRKADLVSCIYGTDYWFMWTSIMKDGNNNPWWFDEVKIKPLFEKMMNNDKQAIQQETLTEEECIQDKESKSEFVNPFGLAFNSIKEALQEKKTNTENKQKGLFDSFH
jgi:hypothetical protein